MQAENHNTAPAPTWDTTTTPPPTSAPAAPESEPAPGRSRGWIGWLLAALIIGGLVWAKYKYFPSTAGGKEGGKGAAGKGGPAGGKAGKGGGGGPTPVQVYAKARPYAKASCCSASTPRRLRLPSANRSLISSCFGTRKSGSAPCSTKSTSAPRNTSRPTTSCKRPRPSYRPCALPWPKPMCGLPSTACWASPPPRWAPT
jgi:hypothetical protein